MGSWHGKHRLTPMRPSRRMTRLQRCSPHLRHLRDARTQKGLKERLTASPLKVAEYEHQFKTIDEAQKIFVVREMMPMDIKRECLTGPRGFDEIMEKLEIVMTDMMADDGPVPMDLENVGTHDMKMTQSDSDTSNDMSCEDVCAIAWKGYKSGNGAGKKDDGGKKGGKKGSKGSKSDEDSDKDKGNKRNDKGKGKGESET